ncbi:HNH endonuclease family protein [Mycobacterium sp.]|uniref:HNH endonuclease family protein n=1 Tax=Mycobacterium sp. TaxID=1785 RepID=UPI003C74554A
MTRKTLLWLSAIAVLAVLVAYQVAVTSQGDRAREFAARADVPTVAPGVDVLAGITVVPARIHRYDYRRAAYGDAWTDDNDAPGGHNGCDTRDDILDRDLVDKTYVWIKRCPTAVETGTLHDPYTSATINFHRGAGVGASVEIDHIVPLALAWDMAAYDWPAAERVRFANDPANLLAVDGKANEDKGDSQPALWMPPNNAFWCQYAMQYIAVSRGYGLPIDQASADALRQATATCPAGQPS